MKDDWKPTQGEEERNHPRVTSVPFVDWTTALLPPIMSPGRSPVGCYAHVEG